MKRRTKRPTDGALRAIGYLRVSTEEQADTHAGLDAQRNAIEAEVETRGWSLLASEEDAGISGKSMTNRPGLGRALEALECGAADVLIVSKLDRLSRSLLDFAGLLARSNGQGWRMVILDLAVDTTTASGEVTAHVAAAFSQYERRLISDRTRAALHAVKQRGVRLGRPRSLPYSVVERVVRERAAGSSFAVIARGLDADRIPTAHGGSRWYPATIAAVVRSATYDHVA